MQNDSGCCGEKWSVVRPRGEEDPSWRPRECICLSVAPLVLWPSARADDGTRWCKAWTRFSSKLLQEDQKSFPESTCTHDAGRIPWFISLNSSTHRSLALAAVCADNQLFMGLIKLVITINNISGESLVPEPADEAQARGDGDWPAEGAGRRRVGAERRADDAARAGGQQRRRGGHRLWIVSAEDPLHLHIRTFIRRSSYFWPRLALASRVECTLVIQTAFLEEYHHQSPTRGLVLYVFQIIEFNIWVCLEHYVIILVMV